ncbi:MAG: PAS domain S-box protein [Anaerolineaceae bacterium]|nr:MAG: PAS domain S-box protein [Anaerolineaceae bacterium]
MGDRNITKQESDDKAVEVTRRTSRITIREPQSYGDRIIIIGVSVLGVAVAYLITDPYLNPVTGILAVVPVTITGLLLGKWAGLIAGLLTFPSIMILMTILRQPVSNTHDSSSIVIIVVLSGLGFLIGRLRDIRDQLKTDLKTQLRGELEFWGSKERYEVLDTAFTGIAVTDNAERLLYCNTTFAEMLGYVTDELHGMFYSSIMNSDEYFKINEHIDLMQRGIPTQYEVMMKRKDGIQRVMLVSSVPRFSAYGIYNGALSIIFDITDRKNAEEALADSESKFRTLAEQSPNMIFINKLDKVVYANPLCEQMMGYTSDEFYSPDFDFMDLIAPDSREIIRMNFEQHRAGKDIPPYEYSLITKEGKKIEAIITTKLIHYDDAQAILGIITDVTDRVKTDEALRASEERYRAIFEQAADSIILADAKTGVLVEYNDQTWINLGYTEEEFKSLKVTDFEVVETPEVFEQHLKQVTKKGSDTFLTKHRRKDGSIRDIQVSCKTISIHGKEYIQAIWSDITRLTDVQEALRESEERYRQLIEEANDIIYETDINGNFIFVNSVVKNIVGYSEKELLGTNFVDLIHPDWQQEANRFYRSQFAERTLNTYYEFPVIAKDGSEVWFGQNVQLSMEGDHILGFQSVARDITDRKQAEEELRMHEARLQSIITATPTGIGLVLDRVILNVNEHFCEMVGYSADELIGEEARLLYPTDEEYEHVGREKYAQIREHGRGTVETRLIRKDGEIIDVLLSSVVVDPDDPSAGITFSALDITERKRAMETLRENEERFRALADTAMDGILMIDGEGKISYWNPSAEKIFGHDSDEVMGMDLHKVILREGCHQEYFEGLTTFMKSGEVPAIDGVLEFEAVKKDGTEFPIRISISTFQINGEWNAVGIIREATD